MARGFFANRLNSHQSEAVVTGMQSAVNWGAGLPPWSPDERPWLITGASGLLGRALSAWLAAQGQSVVALRNKHGAIDHPLVREIACDLTDLELLGGVARDARPSVIVHAAAVTNVDTCETAESQATFLAAEVGRHLARSAFEMGAGCIYISTDQLWDGYAPLVDEHTPLSPINAYGRSKAAGERAVLEQNAYAVVARVNFFGEGPPWRPSFSDWVLNRLRSGEPIDGFQDSFFTPIALHHLCAALARVGDKSRHPSTRTAVAGPLHLGGRERISKYAFICRLAEAAGFDSKRIGRKRLSEAGLAAPRPLDMSMRTERAAAILGQAMPDVAAGLATLAAVQGLGASHL